MMHGQKNIKLLHNVFINYYSDMFRPQLSAIFREFAILSTCAAYVLNYVGETAHTFPNVININFKIKILHSLNEARAYLSKFSTQIILTIYM